jgi:hypothetical protein
MRYLVMVVALLIALLGTLAAASAQRWLLLEPPVDETSDRIKVLDEAPLAQWTRIGTYEREATCESQRNEALKAAVEEYLRMSKLSPLPPRNIWLGAARDRRRAEASSCISGDDPRLAPESPR